MPVQNPPLSKAERKEYVDPNKFDLRTHETDARGRIRGTKLYRLHSKDGVQLFERPVDSGNLFYENNEAAGRVVVVKDKRGRIVGKKFDRDAEHMAFKTPLNKQEEIEQKLAEANARAAAAEKELAAIRAEKGNDMGQRMVGNEIYDTPEKPKPAKANEGVARSAKDDPIAEAVHAGEAKQEVEAPQTKESTGKAEAPRPGPTPNAIHAKQEAVKKQQENL